MRVAALLLVVGIVATAVALIACCLDSERRPLAAIRASDRAASERTTVGHDQDRMQEYERPAAATRTDGGKVHDDAGASHSVRTAASNDPSETTALGATHALVRDSESPDKSHDAEEAEEAEPRSLPLATSGDQFPEDAQERIWQLLSANQHLNFTSVDRVVCRATVCEIRFTGGPDLSSPGPLTGLLTSISRILPMTKSAMMSSRVELAPGIYSSVIVIRTTLSDDSIANP